MRVQIAQALFVAALLSSPVVVQPTAHAGALNLEVSEACLLGRAILEPKGPAQPQHLLSHAVSGPPLPRKPSPQRLEEMPSEEVVAMWNKAAPSNLLQACPTLPEQLNRRARAATNEEAASGRLTLLYYSAPTFNRTGTEAILVAGYKCPGLCRGEELRYYRKVSGSWRLTFSWPLLAA